MEHLKMQFKISYMMLIGVIYETMTQFVKVIKETL